MDVKKEEGQAVFEFLVFLPLLMFLLTVLITIGNSINGSINQQKATRRYFFYIIKGNSTLPRYDNLQKLHGYGHTRVGMSGIGWRGKSEGKTSFGTCYRFLDTFSDNQSDTGCGNPQIEDGKSNFVRIFTYFGVCGETYRADSGGIHFEPDYASRATRGGCLVGR